MISTLYVTVTRVVADGATSITETAHGPLVDDLNLSMETEALRVGFYARALFRALPALRAAATNPHDQR